MARLLYIKASSTPERSHSIAVADAFIDAYKEANPGDDIDVIDLFDFDLPEFDRSAASGKYALLHGKEVAPEDKAAWKRVVEMIDRFKMADRYVFAVPMWNFGIPYRLKQFIDVIIQPGLTFSYDPEKGYQGLVTGRSALAVYARGGDYTEGTGFEAYDHQKPYFETALGFMGIVDVESIIVQPTLMAGPEAAAERRSGAIDEARGLAKTFGRVPHAVGR